MKSIKEYQCSKESSSLQSITSQSLWYTRCCIMSVSLMSGFGLPWNYDNARVDKWFRALDNTSSGYSVPENVTILRAVYKKGSPRYYNAYNGNDKDYRNYMWDDSSFKKNISPASQAYLIMGEIMLAKYFHNSIDERFRGLNNQEEKLGASLLLFNSAIIQSQFMSDYLRNSDGLFISKTDISDNPFGEPVLEEIDTPPGVSDQALVMKAYYMLSDALNDNNYPLFINESLSRTFMKYADEIYEVFQDSHDDIYEGKTRDLCNVITSCIQCCKSSGGSSKILEYVTQLSLELESRVDMSGNLMRFPDENKLTSNSSCFLALKTLIESYRVTDIYKLLNTSYILYKKLNLLWDPINSLYLLDNDDKYRYTSRDVGSVISGLNAMKLFGESGYRQEAGNRLVAFFNSAVNASRLIQSSLPLPDKNDYEGYTNCLRCGSESVVYGNLCSPDIPQSLEQGAAPVFAKKFTFKPKKHKFDLNNDSFYSEYALFTACEMLHMSYPEIECYYDKKACIHPRRDESLDNIMPGDTGNV